MTGGRRRLRSLVPALAIGALVVPLTPALCGAGAEPSPSRRGVAERAAEPSAESSPSSAATAGHAGESGSERSDTAARDLARLSWVIDSFLARPHLSGAAIGIVVESLGSGEVLYERNADAPMIPASNMKLVTGACALSLLGPNHRFPTELLTEAAVVGRTLEGDLYVRGTGDPSLVSEELWRLVERIRAYGIERIAGDIVFDASYFDSLPTATPEAADGDRAYHARTGALTLNFNAVEVHVRPGDRAGDPLVAVLSPATGFVELRNDAVTGSARKSASLLVRRTYERRRNVVTVEGTLPAGAPERVVYRNLDDPLGYFAAATVRFIEAAGIAVGGSARAGLTPPDATVLLAHESKPLSLVVRDLGKFSNNVVAENLLKSLAAEKLGPPGTTAGGASVLDEYLKSVGADSGSYRIVDGSGFSQSNRLSARAIAGVLRGGLLDFDTSYELAASLSVSGTDGTLEDRMGYSGLSGGVRAKTGLLDGVTAISGLLETVSGEEVLFSILVNGFACEAWRVHDLEHAILTSIAGWSATPD